MALDVNVTITLAKPSGKAGTWFPLLYVINGEGQTGTDYDECSNLDEVVTAGYIATGDAYKAAQLIFMQDNAPEKIAILRGGDTPETVLPSYLNKSWRQLIVLAAYDEDVAEYIETTDKMYFTHFADTSALTTAATTISEYDRTFAVVYDDPSDAIVYPEAAVVGATAGRKAGSFTYKNIVIKGVAATNISDSDLTALHTAGGVTIVEKAGDIVTSDGIVVSGEFADVVDSKDYITSNISCKVQKVFNNNAKVPYTNAGIAMLEAATLEALVDGYNNGMISTNADGSPAYSASFALRSETSAANRADRAYPYGQFAFELAGAIHNATINGEITV